MKYYSDLACLLCLILVAGCTSVKHDRSVNRKTLDEIIADFNTARGRTLIAAHRGDWRNAPENSLAAIHFAIRQGVDIVEIDIKKTKDGQLILMHDETIDRTTNATGKVSDWTWDSLKVVRLRNGLGRVTDSHIPTLVEAMQMVKGHVMVNLDKSYGYFPEVMAILESTGTTKQAIMKGEVSLATLRKDYGRYLDQVVFMPVISLSDSSALQRVKDYSEQFHPKAFEFIFATDTSRVIQQFANLQKQGARIWVNSLWPTLCAGHDDDKAITDPDANWGWLLRNGANILQTDRPEMLNDYLNKVYKLKQRTK